MRETFRCIGSRALRDVYRCLCIASLVAACSEDTAELSVDLRTDLVAGIELDAARVRLGDREVTRQVSSAGDYVEGERLVDFRDLPLGDHRLTVELLLGSSVVAARPVSFTLRGDQSVTVVISRDCRGTMCAGGDETLACFRGQCVSAACTPENPSACPADECDTAATCPAPSACATAECSVGTCLYRAMNELCESTQYCDPTDGCADRTIIDAGVMDAGPRDSGPMDAGLSDSGPMDAGPMDAGPSDSGPPDAGIIDAGPPRLGAQLRSVGAGSSVSIRALAADDAGNLYFTGFWSGTLAVETGTMPVSTGTDSFVGSVDADDAIRWFHLASGAGAQQLEHAALTPAGFVVAGATQSGRLRGTTLPPISGALFLDPADGDFLSNVPLSFAVGSIAASSDGIYASQRGAGGDVFFVPTTAVPTLVASVPNGIMHVVPNPPGVRLGFWFSGSTTFGGTTYTTTGSRYDTLIFDMPRSGSSPTLRLRVTGGGSAYANALAGARLQAVVSFTTSFEVAGRVLSSDSANPDIAIVRFETDGSLRSLVKIVGGTGIARETTAWVDSDGSVIVGGRCDDDCIVAGQSIAATGSGEAYVVRLGIDGALTRRIIGGPGTQNVTALVRDSVGRLWAAIEYTGPTNAPGGALPRGTGAYDSAIVQIDL